MSFFKSLGPAVGKMGGMLGAAPKPVPTAGGRKVAGGFMGSRMAPQAAMAPQAVAPQKPGSIWDKFRKK